MPETPEINLVAQPTETGRTTRSVAELGADGGRKLVPHFGRMLPGLALAAVVAAIATLLGHAWPVVGAPIFGIAMGLVVALMLPAERRSPLSPGLTFGGKQLLQAAVVVLGAGLSIREIAHVGVRSLPVMLGTLAVALGGAFVFGRALGISKELTTLIGVGTGICGASAIAATKAVIDADEAETTYAVTTIFAFNVIAVLLYPGLGRLLHLSQHSFGLWAGTAINDTSSVVAAATVYGSVAGAYGVIVKLTRTLMIAPICVALAASRNRATAAYAGGVRRLPLRRMLPTFILLFLVAAALDSAGLVPHSWHGGLSTAATVLITVALTSIGLSAKLGDMRRTGYRPLLLGAILWLGVGVSSLALQAAFGQL